MHARDVLLFGLLLSLAGLAVLDLFTNVRAAFLAFATIAIYILVYTPMKRMSTLNTLIGAIPGALPPLIGCGGIQFAGLVIWVSASLPGFAGACVTSGPVGAPGVPLAYQVQVSMDGTTWGSPIAEGKGSGDTADIAFAPVRAKFVRITQTGSADNASPWSVRRLRLYEAGSGAAPAR